MTTLNYLLTTDEDNESRRAFEPVAEGEGMRCVEIVRLTATSIFGGSS